MSLKPVDLTDVPAEFARVARVAFHEGNLYLKLRDELGTDFTYDLFAQFFSDRDCPAKLPARLTLISFFQFAKGLGNRAANGRF